MGRTAEILAWGDGLVLKLLYEGFPPQMAEDEARVTGSLHELGLSVPRVEGVTEVDGRPGVIFERVDGPSMLAQVTRAPWPVSRAARRLADLHAAMHVRRQPDLPRLRDALERRIQNAPGLTAAEKERTLSALSRLPEDEIICHGDFHPDNILMSSGGPVIIDWIDAHRGHPVADVAKTSLLLHVGEPPEGTRGRWLINRLRRRFLRAYLKRYRGLRPLPLDDLVAWRLPVAAARLADGIPQEQNRLLAMVRSDLAPMP
ncbi:MAG: phosphotransferase family protein [Thermoplasmata archaeon]